MVLPIGLMCCQHQHLGYLPIFGCIGCVQHHVGNVAIGERLFAFVTDRVRTSTSEWVSISLISFNDGESNVAGDCKSRQIERAYQGKQGVNAVSGRSLLY